VASTFAVMAAAMLAEAYGGTAEARRLAARWTRKITAREARAVMARNASTRDLQLNVCLVGGLGLRGVLGFCIGFSFETSGVLGSGLPVRVFGSETLGRFSGTAE
jgi:hypothetical protein